jgi:hypothetical protein
MAIATQVRENYMFKKVIPSSLTYETLKSITCSICQYRYHINRMSTLPLTKERWAHEWKNIQDVARNNNFPNKLITNLNSLSLELNLICYLLALLAHHFLHISRIRVKSIILRLLMSYIWSTYS